MMRVDALAKRIGVQFDGDGAFVFARLAEPALARENDLAMAADAKYLGDIAKGNAKAAVVPVGTDWQALGLEAVLFAPSARAAMVDVSRALEIPWQRFWQQNSIHPSAIIHPTAEIEKSAVIGPFAIIGPRCKIGANSIIGEHVSIAQDVSIGANSEIYAGVRIGPEVRIGTDCVIMHNSVIGGEGFSYQTPNQEAIRAARDQGAKGERDQDLHLSDLEIKRIYSLGSVEIGDRVEIGSLSAIDRGTIKNTRIGNGTKIDNLVQIGHNAQIGENVLICGQAGVAGSAKIGDRTILGGQVAVSDQISVGSDVIIGGQSGVNINIASGQAVMGTPPVKMETAIEMYKASRRLPRLFKQVKNIETRLQPKGACDE